MAEIFSPQYKYFWAALLALALFFPVRNLLHVLYVRRAQKMTGDVDEAEQARLKKRAGVTSALLCFVFSFAYTAQLVDG